MIIRTLICVPTYNNAGTISGVVQDILNTVTQPILVIDDGSSQSVEDILNKTLSPEQKLRVQVIRFPGNQGKGAAIQKAIRFATENNFTHLLTLDADGQHYSSEIHKLLEQVKKDPWSLVIGSRKMSEDKNVPGVSKFGRSFSNFWVKYQTGLAVRDSQSGMRVYPIFYLQNEKFVTKRYDFEIEVLIRLLWKDVRIHEVEIDVYYPKPEERVSHFDKFTDNVRISVLNTLLVVVSLFRMQISPIKIAFSVFAGVVVGTTPFFGFHTFLAILCAFLFRLNFVVVFLGTQISFPPFIPFLIYGSVKIGSELFRVPLDFPQLEGATLQMVLEFAETQFKLWLAGSFVLGMALGAVLGIISYLIFAQAQKSKENKTAWSGRTRGGKFGNAFLKWSINAFGIRFGYFLLLFIIPYFYVFAPRARRGLDEYYRVMTPELGIFARQWRIMKHLYRFGQTLMDRIAIHGRYKAGFDHVPNGLENIFEALKEKNGLILLTAHVGGWDQAGALLRHDGFDGLINVLEYRAKQSFQELQKEGHEHMKYLAHNREEAPIFNVHQMLTDRQPMAMMADRPMTGKYDLFLFGGALAPFDTTPFRLAATTGTPVVVTFGFKANESDKYEFYALKNMKYEYQPEKNKELQVYEWTQGYVRELEKAVRKYSDQWFNLYPFWSSFEKGEATSSTYTRHNLKEELSTSTFQKLATEPHHKNSDARRSDNT